MNKDRDRWLKRKPTPQDLMLTNFLRAKTPQEKREVIKQFNPYFFVLTGESK